MSKGTKSEQKGIVVETSPIVLDRMMDYYTENYRYFLHKDQMKDIDVKPTSKNNFNGNKRVPKGKTFKPRAKRTYTPRKPIQLPFKVEYLQHEFKALEIQASKECENEKKYYQKLQNWIRSHDKHLSEWERNKIYGYRTPQKVMKEVDGKRATRFRVYGA